MACELVRVGTIDNLLRDACHPIGSSQVKIFGDDNGGGYGLTQYLGQITLDEERHAYFSAMLSYVTTLDVALKVIACGGCPVTSNPDLFQFAVVVETMDDLDDLIDELDEFDV